MINLFNSEGSLRKLQLIWKKSKIEEKISWIRSVRNIVSTSFWKKFGNCSNKIREKDSKPDSLIAKWINFTEKIWWKKHFSLGERTYTFTQTYLQRRIWKHSEEIDLKRYYKHSRAVSEYHWHLEDENRWNWWNDKGEESSKGIICFCFE